MPDASKVPLLLCPFLRRLIALHFTGPAGSVWFETSPYNFKPISASHFTVSSSLLRLFCSLSMWHVIGFVLPSFRGNNVLCPPFPSSFYPQEGVSGLLWGLPRARNTRNLQRLLSESPCLLDLLSKCCFTWLKRLLLINLIEQRLLWDLFPTEGMNLKETSRKKKIIVCISTAD